MSILSALREHFRRKSLVKLSPEQVFTGYFHRNKWRDPDSRSGKGSNLAATAELRKLLPGLLAELGIHSMVDVPCGDFFWMQHVDLSGVRYLGGDIVPDLIARNQSQHARDGIDFKVIDLITGPVPKADLIFVRDCLVHLSHAHVFAALENIRQSGATYLLTTIYPKTAGNVDIVTGQWRALDLGRAPFRLPPPLKLIAEGAAGEQGQGPDKMLGLWRVADIPAMKALG